MDSEIVEKRIGWARIGRDKRENLIQLKDFATKDPLTGTLNREGLYQCVQKLIDNLGGNKDVAINVYLLDIDNFKIVNDRLGHKSGDKLLKLAAEGWKQILRRSEDLLARWGGDEFVVVALGGDPKNMQENLLGAFNKKINEANIPADIKVGLSIGKATIGENIDNHQTPLEAALEIADKRMYDQKIQKKQQYER